MTVVSLVTVACESPYPKIHYPCANGIDSERGCRPIVNLNVCEHGRWNKWRRQRRILEAS